MHPLFPTHPLLTTLITHKCLLSSLPSVQVSQGTSPLATYFFKSSVYCCERICTTTAESVGQALGYVIACEALLTAMVVCCFLAVAYLFGGDGSGGGGPGRTGYRGSSNGSISSSAFMYSARPSSSQASSRACSTSGAACQTDNLVTPSLLQRLNAAHRPSEGVPVYSAPRARRLSIGIPVPSDFLPSDLSSPDYTEGLLPHSPLEHQGTVAHPQASAVADGNATLRFSNNCMRTAAPHPIKDQQWQDQKQQQQQEDEDLGWQRDTLDAKRPGGLPRAAVASAGSQPTNTQNLYSHPSLLATPEGPSLTPTTVATSGAGAVSIPSSQAPATCSAGWRSGTRRHHHLPATAAEAPGPRLPPTP
jgi:hypothetical protein